MAVCYNHTPRYGNLVWAVRRDFMKYKRIQFLVISIIALLVMSCLVASALDISSSKHFGIESSTFQCSSYMGNYNLIYGTWEVTGYLAEGKGCDKQALESNIGTQISYKYNELKLNGIKYTIEQYIPYVIAMEDRMLFIGSDYYSLNEQCIFNTNSPYFVAFTPVVYGKDTPDLAVSQIIIKDNNTLILKTNVGYCILSRKAFLDDLDILIPPV